LRSHLETGDMRPTASYYAVYNELFSELEIQLEAWSAAMESGLPKINQRLKKLHLKTLSE